MTGPRCGDVRRWAIGGGAAVRGGPESSKPPRGGSFQKNPDRTKTLAGSQFNRGMAPSYTGAGHSATCRAYGQPCARSELTVCTRYSETIPKTGARSHDILPNRCKFKEKYG